jgi:hypothetical protein
MNTPGFTAEASLHRTTTNSMAASFSLTRRGARRLRTPEDRAGNPEVVPARLPPGHFHGACRCESYDSNGKCKLWLC